MLIRKPEDTQARTMDMPGASMVTMRLMVGRDDGAPNFAMRMFEVQPGGHTPRHQHNYEHEILIMQGEAAVGTSTDEAQDTSAKAGDVLFIPANQTHQFRNTGQSVLKFMCLVPTEFDCGGSAEPTPGSF
jgi:quercetin dioxygenase-like cupin family protein